ncbi:MAG: hypothetical protein ABH842_05465 [Candidatus Micrarchaeota archaeon]
MDLKYVLMLLLVPFVTAASGYGTVFTGEGLSAAQDYAECKADFYVDIIGSHEDSSLDEYADNIEDAMDTLNEYTIDDLTGFGDDVADFDAALKEAKDAVTEYRENLTFQEKLALNSQYWEFFQDYTDCVSTAIDSYREAKINSYTTILANAKLRIDDLAGKGIDTTDMEEVVEDAESEILDPLKSGETNYCMYNGCYFGENYHFAARFDVVKLRAITDYLKEMPGAENLTSNFSEVNDYLDDVDNALASVGGNVYAEGEYDAVWEPLQDAAEALKDIMRELR